MKEGGKTPGHFDIFRGGPVSYTHLIILQNEREVYGENRVIAFLIQDDIILKQPENAGANHGRRKEGTADTAIFPLFNKIVNNPRE